MTRTATQRPRLIERRAACQNGTPLLTAREVGEVLGVSTETVLRWTRRGDLPGFRLPSGQLRYRQGDLDDWLTQRSTEER